MSEALTYIDGRLQGAKGSYETFIGFEVHIRLLTRTKAFCGCRSAFGDEPNTNVCPGCMGYPGTLPTLNIEAMRIGCTVARALHCRIPEETWFERKQYFYPDLSKNVQITQFASPLGQDGYLDIEGKTTDGAFVKKRVRIKECHLEEDAGKMIHSGTKSFLDYNRAGVALLEIVTQPDLETGEESELFVQQLRRLVRYLGACDGNMEEGSLKADANVSINHPGSGLGRRVEIKNLNSTRFMRLGINHELARHRDMLDAGKEIAQETRLWNENRDRTEPMRTKENAQDYRYFFEPDIPVFTPDEDFLRLVEASLVELPPERKKRLMETYGLSDEQAEYICDEKALADYFEKAVDCARGEKMDTGAAAQGIYNWLHKDIKHILNREGLPMSSVGDLKLGPARLASLVVMTSEGKVSAKNARETLEAVLAEDKDPLAIIKEKGWEQVSDPAAIALAVKAVYEAEAKVFAEIRAAGENPKRRATLTAYLVGKVLAATKGRADPKIAGAQIEDLIKNA